MPKCKTMLIELSAIELRDIIDALEVSIPHSVEIDCLAVAHAERKLRARLIKLQRGGTNGDK